MYSLDMNRTWPPVVYEIAFGIGAIAAIFILERAGFPHASFRGLTFIPIAAGILAIILTGIVDFFVHGMWRRPPSDPDPWDGLD